MGFIWFGVNEGKGGEKNDIESSSGEIELAPVVLVAHGRDEKGKTYWDKELVHVDADYIVMRAEEECDTWEYKLNRDRRKTWDVHWVELEDFDL